MAANWVISTPLVGGQDIETTSTTQRHPLGTIVRAKDIGDTNYGAGEFIYLLGVANTLAGCIVKYDASTYQTALADNTKYSNQPVAIAMSANVAAAYGWYQIEGMAQARKTAVKFAPQVAAYASATAGQIKSTASIGTQIRNARGANLATVTSTASNVTLLINRPYISGSDNVTTAGA